VSTIAESIAGPAGDTGIGAMSALNLRLDALKRLVLEQFSVIDESSE
jgi:hypothetical protein